ncbi:MAG TPA: class I SAM-dependent methyltransferase [Dehalococcoidales bacterium]
MSYMVADVNESIYKTGDMHGHFSRIASQYQNLRITDLEPIAFMVRKLNRLPYIKAADIGCGAGRYDRILYRDLGEKLSLTCVDANANMLEALRRNLIEDGIQNFTSIQSSAEDLPLPDNSYDCIFTLNAIHHFDLFKFLHQSTRILKSGGYLFVYTRLRDQNKRNIWGRYFPRFHQKETRLYTLNKMTKTINAVPGMWLQSVEYYKYRRLSSLSELEKRIRSHHYSTFSLYTMDELEKAIGKFKKKIGGAYEDVHRIHWHDENILFVIRKGEESIYNSE